MATTNSERRLTPRSLISGSVVLVAWAVTMVFLLRDSHQVAIPEAPTDGNYFGSVHVIHRWRDVEEAAKILKSGTVIGATITTIRQTPNDNLSSYTANISASVKFNPLLPGISFKALAHLDKSMALQNLQARADLGITDIAIAALVDNEKLYVKTSKSNSINRSVKSLNAPISLASVARNSLPNTFTLAPGKDLNIPVNDPLLGNLKGTLKLHVKERTELKLDETTPTAYRVESELGDIRTVMWMDRRGQILRRQLVGDIIMDKTSRAESLKIAPDLEAPLDPLPITVEEFRGIPEDTQESPGGLDLGILKSLMN